MDPENQVGNHNTEPASQSSLNHDGCDTDDVARSGPVTVPSCPGLTSDSTCTDQPQDQVHVEPVTSSDKHDVHDDQPKDSDEGVEIIEALNFEDGLASMKNIHDELQEQTNRLIELLRQCEAMKLKLQAMLGRCQLPAAPDLHDPSTSIANTDNTVSEDLQSEDSPPALVGGHDMSDPGCSTTTAASFEPLPVDISIGSSADWERLGARPKQNQMQHQRSLHVESGSTGDQGYLGARPKQSQMQHQQSLPVESVSSGSTGDQGYLETRPKQSQMQHQQSLHVESGSSGSTGDQGSLGTRQKQSQMQHQQSLPVESGASGSTGDQGCLGTRPKQSQMQHQQSLPEESGSSGSTGGQDSLGTRPKQSQMHPLQSLPEESGSSRSLFFEGPLQRSPCADRSLSNRSTADWGSLDAQPLRFLQLQDLLAEPEIISPLPDGVTNDCLLRNSRDPTILERIVPQQEAMITACPRGMCKHYQHHCRVRFPCCAEFYPCHRCHNNSSVCDNKGVKPHHATHFLCSYCCHEQEVDGNNGKCHRCGRNMSAYVCFNCGHFSCTDEVPYQCEMCGICRIQTEKACQDQCCFCLEDAFSGRQWLPCSHTVHRECFLAMIQDGIIACPICRYPLYNPSGW